MEEYLCAVSLFRLGSSEDKLRCQSPSLSTYPCLNDARSSVSIVRARQRRIPHQVHEPSQNIGICRLRICIYYLEISYDCCCLI